MRNKDESQDSLFLYGSLEQRIPAHHPLRPIRQVADEAMPEDFGRLYSPIVMVLYSILSERRLSASRWMAR